MKVKRVSLLNFKSYGGEVSIADVSEEVNVIVGKNGAGKSTLLSALRLVIDAHRRFSPFERRSLISESALDLEAYVEVEFENRDRAFPTQQDAVVVRRTVSQRSDEYTVDGEGVTKEAMVSLFETAGVTRSMPYFVLEQGKIGELARMDGKSRMGVIRELAGSEVYEQDKEEGERVLEEAEETEKKIEELVKAIKAKAAAIEEERAARKKAQEIESRREAVVKEIYRRELQKIRTKLESLVSEDSMYAETTHEESEEALKVHLETLLTKIAALRMQTGEVGAAVGERSGGVSGGDGGGDGSGIGSGGSLGSHHNTHNTFNAHPSKQQQIATQAHHPPHLPHSPQHIPPQQHLAYLNKQIEEIGKEIELEQKRQEEVEEEVKKLSHLYKSSKAVQAEMNKVKMQGEKKVKEKLAELQDRLDKCLRGPDPESKKFSKKKEELLEERREIWKKERRLKERKKELETQMKESERSFLISTKGFRISSEIREFPGVIGYVYDIVTMPREILSAVSTAIVGTLVSVIVNTKEDGIKLVRECGVEQTVIPLSTCRNRRKEAVPPVPALSSYVSSAPEYACVVEHLFGEVFYVSDFENGRNLSKRYNINVITSGGEYFSRSGSVTGGEEGSSTRFKRYIETREEFRACVREERHIQESKRDNEEKYREAETQREKAPVLEKEVNREESVSYLEAGIILLSREEFDIEEELFRKKLEMEDRSLLLELRHKLSGLELEKENAAVRETLEPLVESARETEEKLSRICGSSRWKDRRSERVRLEGKFRRVQKKILQLNPEEVENIEIPPKNTINLKTAAKEELIRSLGALKSLASAVPRGAEKQNQAVLDYSASVQKLEDLRKAKKKIAEMQGSLEQKKEEVIGITVRQVRDNVEYFFRKLTQGRARVTPKGEKENATLEIEVSFGGEQFAPCEELSGGQKTILALCIILAVQRIYEAPFYLMDEFDASLDANFLQSIIRSGVFENRQLFICTFRSETLRLGKSFFIAENRRVEECTFEKAQELLCTYLPDA